MQGNMPAPGSVFASKYEIVRPIGRGGMGVVLEARHTRLGQPVAIKLLKEELVGDRESVIRFEREARAAARLTSPHAARIFDVDTTPEGVPFIVMEYLEGRDLGAVFQERDRIDAKEAVDWVLQACIAMAEAHGMGIVHRDLKPSNLFLAETAIGPVLKVLDFGISKITIDADADGAQLTTTATVLGTPHYMSPEQITASRVVDQRADTWALCVILYRALTRSFPFMASHPTALAVSIATDRPTHIDSHGKEIPQGLAALVMHGLEKDPEQRYQSVQELATALTRFGSGKWVVPGHSAHRALGRSSIAPAGHSVTPSPLQISVRPGMNDPTRQDTRGAWQASAGEPKAARASALGRYAMIPVAAGLVALLAFGLAIPNRNRDSTMATGANAGEASEPEPATISVPVIRANVATPDVPGAPSAPAIAPTIAVTPTPKPLPRSDAWKAATPTPRANPSRKPATSASKEVMHLDLWYSSPPTTAPTH